MRLRRRALEPGALVDAARIDEHAARPQADLAVAGGARETDAFVDQPRPDAEPARLRVDEEQTQLGDLVRALLEEDTTDRLAVDVGDPAACPAWRRRRPASAARAARRPCGPWR